jgi:hypothetical protein
MSVPDKGFRENQESKKEEKAVNKKIVGLDITVFKSVIFMRSKVDKHLFIFL